MSFSPWILPFHPHTWMYKLLGRCISNGVGVDGCRYLSQACHRNSPSDCTSFLLLRSLGQFLFSFSSLFHMSVTRRHSCIWPVPQTKDTMQGRVNQRFDNYRKLPCLKNPLPAQPLDKDLPSIFFGLIQYRVSTSKSSDKRKFHLDLPSDS